MLIDAHLDLAYNVRLGRDLTLDLPALRHIDPVQGQTATTTLAELQAAGVRVAFATLFALPYAADEPDGYRDAQGAYAQALAQLQVYQTWETQGRVQILRTRAEAAAHLLNPSTGLGLVLLMEGADPIREPSEVGFWVEQGVRIVGPAWQGTRYAGGTGQPGPLSREGVALVREMVRLGLTLDASHLDDAAFWQAHELGVKMIASHSNSRALVEGNRHLSDAMAQAIAERGGVIGLVLHSRFIRPGWVGPERASLSELAAHARHYAALVGWAHVGIGSDLDGGFGTERMPAGIERYRDVTRLLAELPAEARDAVAWGNWARWLRTFL